MSARGRGAPAESADAMQNTWARTRHVLSALCAGVFSYLLLGGSPSQAQSCAGDCNGDGALSVGELQTGIGIALDEAAVPTCSAIDRDGNGAVRIAELTRAVFARINGCAASPPPAPRGGAPVIVRIGSAAGMAGQTVSFAVNLEVPAGEEVAGVQNDITFTANAPVRDNGSGRPDCSVNPDIDKFTSSAFQPFGCDPGINCTGMRAIVLALDNVNPIPSGLLYTCNVAIAPGTPSGVYPLVGSEPGSSDPNG